VAEAIAKDRAALIFRQIRPQHQSQTTPPLKSHRHG
jgi:hypothetical protein